jgi:copper(I)-binding protein
VGYATIKNTGAAPDRLLRGSADAAGRIEVDEMVAANGVMQTRRLPDKLELKPGATTEFKPGGTYHLT